jgi:hypothetical protein
VHELELRRAASDARKLPGSRWHEDHVTAVLASLLILGLFLDGWNHINLQDGKLGSFFTPWHALLYTGFSATAGWVLTRNAHLVQRSKEPGPWAQDFLGLKVRYPLAVAGIGLATVGLIGDLIWHSVFGQETGVARVIGPFHILLFAGAGLLVTGPLRSAWHDPDAYPAAPSLRTILPALLSLTLITAMAAFIFQWLSAFMDWDPSLRIDRLPPDLLHRASAKESAELAGAARVVMTNVILMGAMLFALRRWRLPFGSVTLLFGTVAALMAALAEFRIGGTVAAAVLGGLVADGLITRLRVSPLRPLTLRVVAGAVPLVLWALYLTSLALVHDVVWPLDLAIGTVALTALVGVVVSVVVIPPAVPAAVWDTGSR